MKKKPNTNYIDILSILKELHILYPSFNMGKHLATALEEYQDLWGISDSEILYSLQKYRATLELNDTPRETNEKEIEKIIKGGMNLSLSSLEEDEDDD